MTAGARGLVIDRRFHVSQLLLVELLASSDVPLHAGLVLDRNGLPSSVHCGYGEGSVTGNYSPKGLKVELSEVNGDT